MGETAPPAFLYFHGYVRYCKKFGLNGGSTKSERWFAEEPALIQKYVFPVAYFVNDSLTNPVYQKNSGKYVPWRVSAPRISITNR